MVWVASVVACIGSFFLGYYLRDLSKKIEALESTVKAKLDKPESQEPKSEIIDPLDPIQEAQYQHKLMMKKLNPDE